VSACPIGRLAAVEVHGARQDGHSAVALAVSKPWGQTRWRRRWAAAVGALRLAGHPNLAAALRHTGRDPARSLAIFGLAPAWHPHETDIAPP
jgi:hypothetical protein